MRIFRNTVIAVAAILGLAACNEALVPDYNTLTGFPHAVGSLQDEMAGAFNGTRIDIPIFELSMDAFSRSSAYFTPSEVRFVTQWTGEVLLDDDNFGANMWPHEYTAVKTADSVIGILPTLTNVGAAIPTASIKGLQGVMQTTKAMDYMYILLSHDTNGIAINTVGGPLTGNLAPIVCARDSWKAIIAMLDTAVSEFTAAGPNTTLGIPNSVFTTLQTPPGYAVLGTTAGTYVSFALALRGRARLEYAYAIARGPGGTAPTATSAGAPDVNQLDSAIADIEASSLYTPSLSATEAIAQNDLGVFQSYSSAAGDISNPLFGTSAATYALESAVRQIDTANDKRFIAKFAVAPGLPTSSGSQIASSMAWLNNLGLSTPIPILRNLQLQFLIARAYLGLGNTAKAAQMVDAIRTTVGGLPSALSGPYSLVHVDSVDANGNVTKTDTVTYIVNTSDYVSVRDFLMREMLPTLIGDATGDQIVAIRDYGLIMQDLTTWGSADYHTSVMNIPATERTQRNNNYAPVCP
jgi:hypothetical protein